MTDKIVLNDKGLYVTLSKFLPKDEFDRIFALSIELTSEVLIDSAITRLLKTDRKLTSDEIQRIFKKKDR